MAREIALKGPFSASFADSGAMMNGVSSGMLSAHLPNRHCEQKGNPLSAWVGDDCHAPCGLFDADFRLIK